ncbi:MAG: methyltransferase domain-containing protein [Parcubacteria group bacterium]|nr:methyltransferase domain-containing protein [Parcubacteria group bacterium]
MSNKDFLKKYKNPSEYDRTFTGSSDDEVNFYSEYVKKFDKVLYLGTGTGRLLRDFLKLNKRIIGVEFSKEMARYSKKLLPKAHIIHQDALKLNLNEKFDLILAPYRFLTHFDPNELKKLFAVVKNHLNSGGYFIGDIFSPYLPNDQTIECEIQCIGVKNNMLEKVYNSYDREEQICVELVEKIDLKSGKHSVIEMPWHYYYPKQLKEAAETHSMKVDYFYGSFKKESMTRDSSELIFVIKKIKSKK